MRMPVLNPPPGWPKAPPGWTPAPGWRPDANWPAPPPGWPLWLPDGTKIADSDIDADRESPTNPARQEFLLTPQQALTTLRVEPPREPLDREVDVVAERDHRTAIARVLDTHRGNTALPKRGRQAVGVSCVLVPQPDHSRGPHTVVVLVDGLQVGYLEAKAARDYSDVLLRHAQVARTLASGLATVGDQQGRPRVTLSMPSPSAFEGGASAPVGPAYEPAVEPVAMAVPPALAVPVAPQTAAVASSPMFAIKRTPRLWIGLALLLLLILLVLPSGLGSTLWLISFVPFCTGLLALIRRRRTTWIGDVTTRGLVTLIVGGLVMGILGLSLTAVAGDARNASPTPAPTPSATPSSPTPSPSPTALGPAAALVGTLDVKGRAPKTGYDRSLFGSAWADTDGNGCDTRNDVLRRDLVDVVTQPGTNGCAVQSGTLADAYSGQTTSYTAEDSRISIDHMVSLSDAWQKGAQQWGDDTRLRFANDPLNLLSVSASLNQEKSDGDAATWLPPNTQFRCTYVARQAAVKNKYGISVTAAEREAMLQVLTGCPGQAYPTAAAAPAMTPDPRPTSVPTTNAPPRVVDLPSSAPATTAPKTAPPAAPPKNVYYKNCAAARAAGAAPLYVGEPGYRKALDRDGDGVACEP